MSRDYLLQPFRAPAQLRIDYARELNAQQHCAVTAPPGPALVLAGAGAGKTRTLIYRAAFLLEQGIPPERILLLTFTNKAAKEMMGRVADLLGHTQQALWGGTFHSIGHRLLRRHAEEAGYRPDFTILDREDAQHLLRACLDEADIDRKNARFPKAEVLASIFSLADNTSKSIGEILAERYEDFMELGDQIQKLRSLFQARKQAANVMDFDDLLVLLPQLFRQNTALCERYQRQFQFILVDEYQDTNQLQCDLIDLLAARHHNIMAVGDDSQSIYSWRGANFQNILKFPERYPGATIYKIETNYRSTPEILDVANAAIAANAVQFAKQLEPVRKSGPKPVVVCCQDAYEQAAFIFQRASELHEKGMSLGQMVVLYRSHFHAMELQMELTRRNMRFSITSGIRFFEQAHIKDVAAYLKLVANPRDESAFKRVIQLLPGIGAKGADKLWRKFQIKSPADDLMGRLQACDTDIPKKARPHWPQCQETLRQLAAAASQKGPDALIGMVLDAGYKDYLELTYENAWSRLEDLEQMAAFGHTFSNLHEFLAQLSLLTNVEADDNDPKDNDEDKLRLSTIHQAKGLEFDVVFIIMLSEGLFPSAQSLEIPGQIEEERRLFYVAITRARDELYLSYPLGRATQRYQEGQWLQPSRFLGEIPQVRIERWNMKPAW